MSAYVRVVAMGTASSIGTPEHLGGVVVSVCYGSEHSMYWW